MVFQPVVGLGGYAGWLILERTETRQREVFSDTSAISRDIDYFRENIKNATSAEALVSDRRLLSVALGAFGLDDEINKRAFIRKILEEGTQDPQAFANRFNDPRFSALAESFSYGNLDGGALIQFDSFSEDIIARYKVRQFDRAVGNTDNDMRLALNFRREIGEIANAGTTEKTKWFQIMGQQPLRELMSTALNIPSEVAQLDVDRQQEIFAEKAEQVFGTSDPSVFSSKERQDELFRRFFLIRQTQNGPSALTPGLGALTILQSSALGASASQNLFLSQF